MEMDWEDTQGPTRAPAPDRMELAHDDAEPRQSLKRKASEDLESESKKRARVDLHDIPHAAPTLTELDAAVTLSNMEFDFGTNPTPPAPVARKKAPSKRYGQRSKKPTWQAGGLKHIFSGPWRPEMPDIARQAVVGQARQGLSSFHEGPVEILGREGWPVIAPRTTRKSAGTARAFKQGTGADSADLYMQDAGFDVTGKHHRAHIKGWGQHGERADDPDNIVATSLSSNGMMTHVDHRYPPGLINRNHAVVGRDPSGNRVAHSIEMSLAHPDRPDVPLFTHTLDPHRPYTTTREWDEAASTARSITPETLDALHRRQTELAKTQRLKTYDDYFAEALSRFSKQ
jgi:hypothetical protein